jgi:pimeloyl-ACP methyl ester carboxylesterase
MLNWYRAVLRHTFEPVADGSIAVPIHIIWGQKDIAALPALAEASKALCSNGTLTYLPDATHWVAHDEPDRVNTILLAALHA